MTATPLSSFKMLWQPTRFPESPWWVTLPSILALCLYSFTAVFCEEPADTSLKFILATGFISLFVAGKGLRGSAPVRLFCAGLCLAMVTWLASQWTHPQWAMGSPKVHILTNWFMFIAIAWWLGGATRNLWIVLALATASLLITPWVSGQGWRELEQGLSGKRIDFGIHNAQHIGMLCSVALLGILVFSPRILKNRHHPAFTFILWLITAGALLAGVIVSQSRGSWLALFLALIVLILITAKYFHEVLPKRISRHRLGVIFCILFLATGLLTWKLGGIVENRLGDETQAVKQVLHGEFYDVRRGSVGARIHSWIAGWEWVKERPLIGWGGNGRSLVFEHTQNLPPWLPSFGHLHNSYLDTLVNFGVLGLALYLCLIGWLLAMAVRLWRVNQFPGDLLTFFIVFLAYWLLANIFESYLYFSTGELVSNLVFGGVLTKIWAAQGNDHATD